MQRAIGGDLLRICSVASSVVVSFNGWRVACVSGQCTLWARVLDAFGDASRFPPRNEAKCWTLRRPGGGGGPWEVTEVCLGRDVGV